MNIISRKNSLTKLQPLDDLNVSRTQLGSTIFIEPKASPLLSKKNTHQNYMKSELFLDETLTQAMTPTNKEKRYILEEIIDNNSTSMLIATPTVSPLKSSLQGSNRESNYSPKSNSIKLNSLYTKTTSSAVMAIDTNTYIPVSNKQSYIQNHHQHTTTTTSNVLQPISRGNSNLIITPTVSPLKLPEPSSSTFSNNSPIHSHIQSQILQQELLYNTRRKSYKQYNNNQNYDNNEINELYAQDRSIYYNNKSDLVDILMIWDYQTKSYRLSPY